MEPASRCYATWEGSHMDEFLLAADVAKLIGRTPATVREAASEGRLPVAALTPAGVRLFRRADVERFCRERKGRSDADPTSMS
jgi:hypothetical protein